MKYSMKNGVIDEKWIGSVIHRCNRLIELVDEKFSDQ